MPRGSFPTLTNGAGYFIFSRTHCIIFHSRVDFIIVALPYQFAIVLFITEDKIMRRDRRWIMLLVPRNLMKLVWLERSCPSRIW